jgi:hypothetical protein
VNSSESIGVFSGVECGEVPFGSFECQHLLEQIPPSISWGKMFVVTAIETGVGGGDIIRVLASEASTVVETNSSSTTTTDTLANQGDFVDIGK